MGKETHGKVVEITVKEYSETSSKPQENRKNEKTHLQDEKKSRSKIKINLQKIQENEKKHAGVTMQPYYYDSYTFDTNLEKVSVSHNERQKREALQEIHWEGEFDPEKVIGCGAFGIVVKAIKKENKKPYALKLLDNESIITFLEHEREVAALTKLSHVNLVSYYGTKEYPNYFCIMLEYVSGGSLVSLMNEGTLSESFTADVTCQVLRALRYLHKKNCVHRDLKPANILFGADGVVKITDFGSSKFLISNTVQGTLTSVKGTVSYMAPEVIQRNKYGKKCDVWSLGCTVFEMLTNTIPYNTQKQRKSALQFFQWKRNCDTSVNYPETLSDACKDFLNSCLAFDPAERPSSKKLFKHHWFKEQKSFEKWENIQSVLSDDSDSKQDATELEKEALEQTRKHPKFCHKFCTKQNRPFWGLLGIISILTAIVVLSITLTYKSPANDKNLNQLGLYLNPDDNCTNNTATNLFEISEVEFSSRPFGFVTRPLNRNGKGAQIVKVENETLVTSVKIGQEVISINSQQVSDMEFLKIAHLEETADLPVKIQFQDIDQDENKDAKDKDENTALHWAVRKNNAEKTQILIEKGADKEATNNIGQSPLHVAAWWNNAMAAIILIEDGANKDQRDSDGNTALHIAALINSVEVVRILVAKGADKNAQNKGDTALHKTARKDNTAVAHILIEAGAEKEAQNIDGDTALHVAAMLDSVGVARILIESGAEKDAKTHNNDTALQYASYFNNIEVVQILIEARANKDTKNNQGYTALSLAALTNSVEAAKILIAKGANKNAQNNKGQTAFDIATKKGHMQISDLLQS